jgi:hypothetical protein
MRNQPTPKEATMTKLRYDRLPKRESINTTRHYDPVLDYIPTGVGRRFTAKERAGILRVAPVIDYTSQYLAELAAKNCE